MPEINKCLISGILRFDPKIKEFQHGGMVCSFTLEAKEHWSSNKTGKEGIVTILHRVAILDATVYEAIRSSLIPGNRFFVEGELRSRSYEDKDGKKQYITEISVNRFKGAILCLGQATDQEQMQYDGEETPPKRQPTRVEPHTRTSGNYKPKSHDGGPRQPAWSDDDIPF